MKTPTPKHRAVIHLAADMRKGAGAHYVARKPGPTVEEWDESEIGYTYIPKDLSNEEWEELRSNILFNTFTQPQ